MKGFNLLLAGHWDINITVEANSKEEAIDDAIKLINGEIKLVHEAIELAGEMSGPFNLTHDKQWMEGEDGVVKYPDYGQLKIPSSERFLQRGKSDIAH